MVSKTLLIGILVVIVIAGITGYFLMQKPLITPTEPGEATLPEVMTDEEIDSLIHSVSDTEAIESELNVTEIDLNIDLG